jgi:hypothetical protein
MKSCKRLRKKAQISVAELKRNPAVEDDDKAGKRAKQSKSEPSSS